MATSAIAGYKADLYFSTSTGGSLSKLAELRDFEVNYEVAEIDATSHDSSGTREVIMGIDSWSGSGELLYVISNTTHKNAFDLTAAKTKIDFEFYPTGSSSDGYYSGTGYLTSFNFGAPTEDALTAGVNFVGTGALTRSSSST